ncbi:MAG TPA: RluA family pseudouridine synthase, partial [Polyangiaceae bacterium]|nr:RluA family pseudouridine synthase [Polyangiaceae bacterium]
GALLARLAPNVADALAEGRVFVGGRRATDAALRLTPGVVVEVHAGRAPSGRVTLLAEHSGLVFVNKPAGVATEPDHAGVAGSLVELVARELALPRGDLHAVSRLDVGVSGVVTFARNAAGRELAAELRARGAFARRYVALAAGVPEPPEGTWDSALARRPRASERSHDPRPAETRYATVARASRVVVTGPGRAQVELEPALLALSPVTGRTHQLRVHAARAKVPLFGDGAYGGAQRLVLPNGSVRALSRVFLHAAWVELELGSERLRVAAPAPDELLALWSDCGGAPDAWSRALEIALVSPRD